MTNVLLFVELLTFLILTDYHYSELIINHASKEHSGNYTCVPSNSQPASVVVHIFKGNSLVNVLLNQYSKLFFLGDHPAAMYHEHRSAAIDPHQHVWLAVFLLCVDTIVYFASFF